MSGSAFAPLGREKAEGREVVAFPNALSSGVHNGPSGTGARPGPLRRRRAERRTTLDHPKWPASVTARNCLAFSAGSGGARSGACPGPLRVSGTCCTQFRPQRVEGGISRLGPVRGPGWWSALGVAAAPSRSWFSEQSSAILTRQPSIRVFAYGADMHLWSTFSLDGGDTWEWELVGDENAPLTPF